LRKGEKKRCHLKITIITPGSLGTGTTATIQRGEKLNLAHKKRETAKRKITVHHILNGLTS